MKFPKTQSTAKELLLTIDDFSGGTNTLIDQSRLPPKFANQSNNLMQVSNGLWKTRWGSQYFGTDLGTSCDGAAEYVKSNGTTELIVIANGVVYKSTDGGSWSSISGATFTAGVQCYFMQMGGYDPNDNTFHNYLYISNGTDALARYDGSTLATYNSLSAPATLTASLTASGLTSGAYTYYAQVTAINTIGETVGCSETSITVNKERSTWNLETDKTTWDDEITWTWAAVASATRYQVYLSDATGYEALVATTDTTSWKDNGSLPINPYVQVPLDNTTTGPKAKSMALSNNRIWMTNNPDDIYKVYFSGTGRNIGAFSDFYGGGWIALEKGGRELPIAVKHYQTGSGQGRATVLCKTPDGKGAVWQIEIITATVGDVTFSVPSAAKVVGSFGTEALLGVVGTDNDIAFPNSKGWFNLGQERGYYNILRTSERSSNIRPYWRSLISNKISGICAYYYDAKIFISVPTITTGNDKIIIYDTERGNWAVDWSIGAKQFLEYTDTGGNSHFLYVPTSGTQLIELSENYMNDLGVKFNQSYISPLLPVSKKMTDIFNLKEAIVELANPRGAVTFTILGVGKDSSFTTIATATITNFGADTGVGSDLAGDFFATSTNDNSSGGAGAWAISFTAVPSVYTQSLTKKALKKRKKIYAIQFQVASTTASTDFTINKLQAKGRLIARRVPSNWAN
ncbi:MAG: hypothetical protein A2163_07820 [Actinobacteria bacterium RBG_13_35_12]|nr:MAG: hypothetical protein A2163_07820 [Actinobacteria bacterium RBG_13_35_12]